jgi:hypothetical protein
MGTVNPAAVLGLILFLASGQHVAPLPARATITVGALESDSSVRTDAEECAGWSLSSRQVRTMFRTYHRLKEGELHAWYLYPSCWIKGTITVRDRTFHWEARPGNTLFTDWPDGVDKMLGGKHSDNPAGE